MWLKSEAPVAAAAVAGAVGWTVEVAEGTRYRDWDCSPAAGTGLGEGSSTRALAFRHGFELL
jgi:hypothetical protein